MRLAAGLGTIVLLAAAPVHAQDAATTTVGEILRWGPDLAKDFEALPRIAGDAEPARAINAFMDRLDERDREARSDCLAEAPDHYEWGRSVEAPMTGPRFVSVIVTLGAYCGGAHPYWSETHYTFDVETGRQIDWAAFLPDEMASPLHAPEYSWPASLASPMLKARFIGDAIAQRRAFDPSRADQDECVGVLSEETGALGAWLDARAPGLALSNAGLPHAVQACTETVVIPLEDLRRGGAAPLLIDAIATAHAEGRWRARTEEAAR
jgi:hypothetical protein